MENLKIRVNSEAESKQAKSLLESLGFDIDFSEEGFKYSYLFAYVNGMHVTGDNREGHFKNKNNKEITLPELRDLVVLKRNDVGDATHVGKDLGIPYFVTSSGDVKVWDKKGWVVACATLDNLKPIEKEEMKAKEYLKKIGNNEYMLMDGAGYSGQDNWIEIPEGAEIYIDLGFRNHSFYKDNFKLCWCGVRWENTVHNSVNLEHWNNTPVLWKRANHPEELPFIDDEPLLQTEIESELDQVENLRELLTPYTPPLNDQYAEIEKVRQSAWQKQEGGSHYKNLKIQPMQYALENKLDYAQANVVKYVTRHKKKNGKEDLLKAIHNIELMIEFYYGGEK